MKFINIIQADKIRWRCDNNPVPTGSSTTSATASPWDAWLESSSTSLEECGTPPSERNSWAGSLCSRKEHQSSEVTFPLARQLRTLGRTLLSHRLRPHWHPQGGRSHQPDHSWSGHGRTSGLPLRDASGLEECYFRGDDPGLDRDRGAAHHEVPEHQAA